MGFKSMTMGWDICSSPPWVTFCPYTMFQNPIGLDLPITNAEKPLIIQKVLVTQSCNIVHCNWHTQKTYMCRFASLCEHFFPVQIDGFSVFCQGEFRTQPKFHILLILTGNNALKLLEWWVFRVWGMPNPMPQVLSLCDKWFLKNYNFRQKISHFVWFWLGQMHWNGLSCHM